MCALQSDVDLLTALNELRLGLKSQTTNLMLSELVRPLPDDGITPTYLFPHNQDVSGHWRWLVGWPATATAAAVC
jgi:hypothetical protein